MKSQIDKLTKDELIAEYKLILQKQSKLSRKLRDQIESRIATMHKNGKVKIEELKIINNQI
ncbi:hypothetical protein [Flavobacterium sp.]|uniref:hypothetical protein n=1 Tax=Flavobacterium sp. TaxID=239 RepID=UPI00262875F1|nr:hypothetical protein [Flavobacterium sp.]